ncbi:hypothetical protein ES332_D05G248500v1 [Gossypium tomentosum]|uniref:Uncharacterized protein n=1 Tax=Gossypium tomentosum TaxID=34277 RepID=A0A5D2KZB8_GOSTO|nr:hypothetical protein ES332_D05G248500v1 [Gossypium tomentosum]
MDNATVDCTYQSTAHFPACHHHKSFHCRQAYEDSQIAVPCNFIPTVNVLFYLPVFILLLTSNLLFLFYFLL